MTGKGPKRKNKLNKAGFTLVEILVSIAILSIAILPVIMALTTTLNMNRKLKKTEDATAAATNMMEEVKANGVKEYIQTDSTGSLVNPSVEKVVETDESGNVVNTYYIMRTVKNINGKDYNVETRFDSLAKTSDESDKESVLNFDEVTDYNATPPKEIKGTDVAHDVTFDTVSLDRTAAESFASYTGKSFDDIYNANIRSDSKRNNQEFKKDVVITIDKQTVELKNKTVDRIVVYAQIFYQYIDRSSEYMAWNGRKYYAMYRYGTQKRCIYRGSGKDTDLQTIIILNKAIPTIKTENINYLADNFSFINKTDIHMDVSVWQQREEDSVDRGEDYNYFAAIGYDPLRDTEYFTEVTTSSGKFYMLVSTDDVSAVYDSFYVGGPYGEWVEVGSGKDMALCDYDWLYPLVWGSNSTYYYYNSKNHKVFRNVNPVYIYPVFLLGSFYDVGEGSVPPSAANGDPFSTAAADGVDRIYNVSITVYERNEDGTNGDEVFSDLTSAVEYGL